MESIPTLEQKLREHLLWLKNNFSDEIPNEILHSDSPNNKFKVRRNWFQGVVADVSLIVDKIKNPAIREEAEKFIEYATSEEFKHKPLTERSDIDWANRVIDQVIGNL